MTLPPLVGVSPAIRRAVALMERYARTPLAVMLVGPTGTGKEVLAHHLHARSCRPGRFVPVNCAALPREMTESLLFGHCRGAFSGAIARHCGYVERAHEGTLFLDELLCLAADAQPKLLRALDEGEVEPLGAEEHRNVNLRVVSALQEHPAQCTAAGSLRADLVQRLAGVVIELPALAKRSEDVMPLAAHFAGLGQRQLERGVDRVLLNYAWPGNVRELRFVIERAGHMVENGTLSPAAVAEAIALGVPTAAPGMEDAARTDSGGRPEREQLVALCASYDWDARRSAIALGIGLSTLYRHLHALRISLRHLRNSQFSRGIHEK